MACEVESRVHEARPPLSPGGQSPDTQAAMGPLALWTLCAPGAGFPGGSRKGRGPGR